MLISVVLNIKNEERYIADLLDSVVIQEGPVEIIVVDAGSEDRTREIAQRYVDQYPFVHLHLHIIACLPNRITTFAPLQNFSKSNPAFTILPRL